MRACVRGTFNFNCVGLFWRWIHLPIHPADSQWDSQQQCTQTDLYCSTAACTAVSLALWLLALRLHLDPLASASWVTLVPAAKLTAEPVSTLVQVDA